MAPRRSGGSRSPPSDRRVPPRRADWAGTRTRLSKRFEGRTKARRLDAVSTRRAVMWRIGRTSRGRVEPEPDLPDELPLPGRPRHPDELELGLVAVVVARITDGSAHDSTMPPSGMTGSTGCGTSRARHRPDRRRAWGGRPRLPAAEPGSSGARWTDGTSPRSSPPAKSRQTVLGAWAWRGWWWPHVDGAEGDSSVGRARHHAAGCHMIPVTLDRRQLPKRNSHPVSRDSQAPQWTLDPVRWARRARLAGHVTRRMPTCASVRRPRPARELPQDRSPARSPRVCPPWRDSCTLASRW